MKIPAPVPGALLVLTLARLAGAATADVSSHGGVATVKAVRAPQPIHVDGRLDDAPWTLASPASGFRQRDPEEGAAPSERTELRVAYDEDALYVGIRLYDREPAKIVRQLSRRDLSGDADRVTLYLDPHHDHLTGAQFEVSAAGVQRDAVIFNDSWDDDSWDAVWESAVSVDEEGWTAELRIPFSQLRFTHAESAVWGINVARFIHRRNESDWLEMVPKKESGVASRMAHLVDLEGIRPRRAFSALPYVVARGEYVAPSEGDPFNDGSRAFAGIGADLKYGITSNLTLDATINPDFGQVEVDPAVVNLTQFETFFQEKRPFFIEGAQIFSNVGRNGANNFWGFNRSEPDLFYTRRIGRSPRGEPESDFVDAPDASTILGAAKLTGKTAAGWSVGVLEALTAREWAQTVSGDSSGREEVEPLTNYFVGRAHRDLRRGGVGLLATSVLRDLGESPLDGVLVRSASVAGLDGYYFLGPKKDWVLSGRLAAGWLQGSSAAIEEQQLSSRRYFQRPDAAQVRLDPAATRLSGWTGSANLNRNSGDLQLNAALWATSPGFEANDLGFGTRSDRWGGHVVGTWRKTDPDKLTRRRSLSVAKWYALNFDGDRQGDGLHVFGNAQLRNYWNVGGNGFKRWRAWDDSRSRGGPTMVASGAWGAGAWLETDTRKRASLALEYFHFESEHGGREDNYWTSLNLKPSSSLSLSLGPTLYKAHNVAQWVQEVADPLAAATYGSRYVFATLDQDEWSGTVRLNWILSPRLSLQLYAQPLLSGGAYQELKELAAPRSFDFLVYGRGGSTIRYEADTAAYTVDPDGPGPAEPFTVDNPDFNFKSLRINAVFRWEWRLGSALYVVWTQNRENSDYPGDFEMGRDARALWSSPADDVFLVKFTYRVGR